MTEAVKGMHWYCGWDGGGTKTTVLCTDAQGCVTGQEIFGPLNPNGNAAETVVRTIRSAAAWMAAQPGGLDGCAGLVIGVAGASNAATSGLLRDQLAACGYHGPLRIVGDQEIALAGALRGPGAVLVAGTGSVCCGRDSCGRLYRTGGYGHLIDDGGSGYAIGRDILAAVVRAEDGREKGTCLRDDVFRALDVADVTELITWLYSGQTDKKEIAALAELLPAALGQGDAAALSIADRAASELCGMVTALWHRAGLDDAELVMSGSILLQIPEIRQRLTDLLQSRLPRLIITSPWGTPAEGAALMARTS